MSQFGTRTSPGAVSVAHVTSIDSTVRLLLSQILYLLRQGYEVDAVCSPGPFVQEIESQGIRLQAVPILRRINPAADLRALWDLYRLFRREQYTIVHTHTPKAALLGRVAAKMAHLPVIVNTVHGFYLHDQMHPAWRRLYIALEKVGAYCSDMMLSQNREDMRIAIDEGICSPDSIKYLGNGIDLTQFDPGRFTQDELARKREELGISRNACVVGFVGRLAGRRKGFYDFLSAARSVSQQLPETRFMVVGGPDPGKPDAVQPSEAEDYGIADQCVFLGRRPNTELPLLYGMMSVLVLPSLFEGVPRVVMEASAMKVPAVVTDVKGNREAVEDGRNGLLVPLGDVQGLADALLELLSDPDRARRMGLAGRRIALERFDERIVFGRVKEEYETLLLRKGLAPPEVPGE